MVVIYYANETSLRTANSPNYKALLETLRRADDPAGTKIADDIESDSNEFRAVVTKDEVDLFQAARKVGFDLAFFDNSKTLNGHFLQFDSTAGSVRTQPFPALPKTDNPILATSPLSRAEALRAAIGAVVSLYPNSALELVLITFTHGSRDMAVIPRVSADLTTPDAQRQFLQQLSATPEEQSPAWAKIQGISKVEYWQIIGEASAKWHVEFPLIFRQSCSSGPLNWSEVQSIPTGVKLIAHSDMENMRIRQIDYSKVFSGIESTSDWLSAFETEIGRNGVQVESKLTIWVRPAIRSIFSLHPIYFFAPLALWLAWVGFGIFRRRKVAYRA